jgi:hypothetical protein
MKDYKHRQLNLTPTQYGMIETIAGQEKKSNSSIARLLLDIGYLVLAGDIEAAQRCANKIQGPAPAYQPENN